MIVLRVDLDTYIILFSYLCREAFDLIHCAGMDFDASYVFKMAREKFTAPGASSPSGRKRAAISSPDVPSPQNPSTSPQPSVVGCVDIELKKSLEQKSLEESRQGLLMEISRVSSLLAYFVVLTSQVLILS